MVGKYYISSLLLRPCRSSHRTAAASTLQLASHRALEPRLLLHWVARACARVVTVHNRTGCASTIRDVQTTFMHADCMHRICVFVHVFIGGVLGMVVGSLDEGEAHASDSRNNDVVSKGREEVRIR